MNYRQSLKICRILVAILLLNMIAPLVVQADDSSAYTLICTSAGLVKVDIESYSPADNSDSSDGFDRSSNHCVYCQLTDQPAFQAINLARHSTPPSNISLFNQRLEKSFSSKSLLRYVQLRAPPVYL